MRSADVYITGWGVLLPNEPVANDQIDAVLGPVDRVSAAVKRRILLNNGIALRHYAIERGTGRPTHTNTQMTAAAIRAAAENGALSLEEVDCLACGTATADQVVPSHGSMVHAELGSPPCEVVTFAGVCCAGMAALKYAAMCVASGASRSAIATGSELPSLCMTAQHFQPELDLARAELESAPMLAFENSFLRWMLSDGAGAALVTRAPKSASVSLKIDWLDIVSFANESDVCMHYGMRKEADGACAGYRTVSDPTELCKGRYLDVAQDVRVLQERLPVLMRKAAERIIKKRELVAEQIDWLVPHYSSKWFRQPLYDGLFAEQLLPIPFERWFTNLPTKGNTGSAAIFIMLEELVSSGRLQTGQRILCLVPESARMTFAFLHMTVV